jgi:hypothetical protein
MKRFVRILVILFLLLAAALLASSVGVVMPRSFQVVGPDGAPAGTWVAYDYRGYRLNLVHPVSWTRIGGIVRSDSHGVARLPKLVYLKVPLDGWLHHDVQTIYAPALHATLNEHLPDDGAVLTIPDNTADPAAWDRALGEIHSLVAYDLVYGGHERYAVAPETVGTLARQLVDDYRALLALHGDRQRELPKEMPPNLQYVSDHDRTEWWEHMRHDIERYPTWGAYLEHRYARTIAKLEEMFGK